MSDQLSDDELYRMLEEAFIKFVKDTRKSIRWYRRLGIEWSYFKVRFIFVPMRRWLTRRKI